MTVGAYLAGGGAFCDGGVVSEMMSRYTLDHGHGVTLEGSVPDGCSWK